MNVQVSQRKYVTTGAAEYDRTLLWFRISFYLPFGISVFNFHFRAKMKSVGQKRFWKSMKTDEGTRGKKWKEWNWKDTKKYEINGKICKHWKQLKCKEWRANWAELVFFSLSQPKSISHFWGSRTRCEKSVLNFAIFCRRLAGLVVHTRTLNFLSNVISCFFCDNTNKQKIVFVQNIQIGPMMNAYCLSIFCSPKHILVPLGLMLIVSLLSCCCCYYCSASSFRHFQRK